MYNGITADLPCGTAGLNSNSNTYQVPINNLVKANNLRYDGFAWRKAPGLKKFNSVAVTGTNLEGYDWRPSSGTQKQVTVWDSGFVYKESGGVINAVTLASGIAPTGPVTLVAGANFSADSDKHLYLFANGVAPLELVADGATMNPITAESADWSVDKPGMAINHDARIVASDVASFPHSLYFSSLDDNGNFDGDDSRVFDVNPGVGDGIRACWSYATNQLLVFKYPYGIWSVDTSDLTGFYIPITKIRDDVGIAGPHALAKVGNDVFFISANGRILSLNTLVNGSEPKDADLTAALYLGTFIKENVSASRLKHARLIYDENRKELWYIFTSTDGDINNMALVFDFNDFSGQVKASVENRGNYFEAAWRHIGTDGFVELMFGGENGFVRQQSINRSVDASIGYLTELQYPDTDFRFISDDIAPKPKRFDMFEITVIPTGNYLITAQFYIDGQPTVTKTISVGADTAVFDSAVFDTDVFAGNTPIKHRVEIDSVGVQFAVKLYNSNANEDFAIADAKVYFKPQSNDYEA